GQGVAQPSSPTLYAGYLLALAVAGVVVGWTLLGGRRRRVISRLRLSGRRRLRWGLARLAAAVRLTAALRRPVRPGLPPARRRRPLPMAVVGLVVWVVVALPVAARAGGVGTEGTVRLQTVPATAGVSLLVGGVPVTTGPDGAAVTRVADLDGIAARVRLAGTRLGATTTVALGRVVPGPHAPRESRLSVGLDLTSLVRLTVAPGTSGVPVSSVRSVRLHALTGQQLTVDPRGAPTVALLARRAQLVAGRLTSQVVTWGVERVLAGPGVAVGTTQPRFDPLGRSSWPLVLQAVSGTVAVSTVPATPGVVLLLDGATLTTGPDGTATAPVSDLNGVADRLRLDTDAAAGATVRLLHVGRLKPRAAGERRLVASLAVSRPVTLRFVDRSGAAVPASRVRAVQLDSGERVVRLTDAQVGAPVLLLAGVGTQEHGRPVARATSWSVSAVDVDGGNAVLAGSARFSASSASWRVPLAVFRVTVTARDALLGHRVGGRVLLTRPDGTTQRLTLRTDRPTVVPPVVRGTYDVALGAAVVGAHTKVLVSRDQAVEVRVVTALDAALVGGGGVLLTVAAVGGGVLLARRRRAA
ncbi:MAG: hypothetical protein ACXVFV_08800, partial [Mycobacteriales bacterium]